MARFLWDENKRDTNLKKHKLDFASAKQVMSDEYAFFCQDPRYSDNRWLLIGKLESKIVIVAYTEPSPDTYRIISMREATKKEAQRYKQEKSSRIASAEDPLVKVIDKLTKDS